MQIPDKEQIWEAIEAMAQSLGVAAEYVWEVVLRQQVALGAVMVIMAAMLIPTGVVFTAKAYKRHSESLDGFYHASLGVVGLVGGSILIAIGVLYLYNPGYYALKAITGIF